MVTVEDIRGQILFEGMDEENLSVIADKLQVLKFKKGSTIFKEKDETRGIYFIFEGKIEISKVTAGGWKQTLAVLGPGHFCGELSIIENRKHEAVAVAIEDSVIFLLAKDDFYKIEKEELMLSNLILKKLVYVMSKNLRRMNEKFLNALVSY
ncbi:MAG TPA: cyclic nucleotide-binding domain-containing protein [Nitrospirae bacterium]|nr:cyclic nucleotide-binding domain-containing protein [Nitrospirota bacterium]